MLKIKVFFEIFVALFLLTAVIFFHELGHYLFARIFNVQIKCFSIGMGYSIKEYIDKKNTLWKIGVLPIGGYIEIVEKKEDLLLTNNSSQREYAIEEISPLKNFLIAFAGPLFNFIMFSILYLCALFFFDFSSFDSNINTNSESAVYQTFVKENKDYLLNKYSQEQNNTDQIKLSVKDAFILLIKKIKIFFQRLNFSPKNCMGPIGIIHELKKCLNYGIIVCLLNIAYLSMSVGICNLLPFPGLDGSYMLISLIEFISCKKFSDRWHVILSYVTIPILVLLFASTTILDLLRLIKLGAFK